MSDINIEQPCKSPDPDAVRDFLLQSHAEGEESIPLDLGVSDLEDAKGSEHEERPDKERADTPRDPTFDEDALSASNVSKWIMEGDNPPVVKVEEIEKRLYFKALLNDEPIVLPISLRIAGEDIVVECRTPTTREQTLCLSIVQKQSEKKSGGLSPVETHTLFQHLSATTQIVSFNSKSFGADADKIIDSENPEDALMEAYERRFARMNIAKADLLVTALRIFSIKMKICNDRLLDEDFWKPADSN